MFSNIPLYLTYLTVFVVIGSGIPAHQSQMQPKLDHGIMTIAHQLDFSCPQINTGFRLDIIHDIAFWKIVVSITIKLPTYLYH